MLVRHVEEGDLTASSSAQHVPERKRMFSIAALTRCEPGTKKQNTSSPHRGFVRTVLSVAFTLPPLITGGLPQVAYAQASQSYNIPAGPLDAVLGEFAATAAITLSSDAEQLRGMQSRGLRGSFTVVEGLSALLGGTGLEAIRQSNGAYTLRRQQVLSTQLSAVRVTATAHTPTTEGGHSYTTPLVTIGKTALALRDIPQSVSVLTRQRMDDQNMTLIETALDQVTGVQLDTTTGAVGSANLYSRGFLVNSYQYDGVPQTFLGTSYTGFDLAVMDRVEVLRGATGMLQGTGNPSATVNLVRKKPTKEFKMSGTFSAGSWNTYRGELDVGGTINDAGTLRGRFVTAYEDAGSFVNNVNSQKSTVYGVVEADLAPATQMSLGFYRQNVNAVPSIFGLPRYSDGRSLGLDRSTVLTPSWNRWYQDIEEVFGSLTHRFENEWKLNASLLHSYQLQNFKRSVMRGTGLNNGVNPANPAGSIYTGIRWNSDSERTNIDVNTSGPVTLFGRKHEFLGGFNTLSNTFHSKSSATFPAVAVANIFSFDPNSVPEPANSEGPFTSGTTAETSQYGFYGSGRFSIADPLKLILGARLSWYKTRTDNINLNTGITTIGREVRYDRQLTPYAGVIYDLNNTYSLYASYADIFQPQTTQFSKDGAVLDPLVGANYEAGIKGEFLNGDINASLAFFRIDQKNRALEDLSNPCASATTTGWCYLAAGKVRSEGVETEVSGKLSENWNLFAGYTYNKTQYLEDRASQGLPFRTQTPKHLFKLWTQYRLPFSAGRWTVGGGLNAQSSYYAMSGSVRSEQEAYAVFKGSVTYQFSDKTSLALTINNIFDKIYYSGIRGVDFGNVYGDPRNAMLTLRVKY